MNWYKKSKIIQSGIETPEPDENLIRRVMTIGSGAVIHKMVGWIGAYRTWARLMSDAIAKGSKDLFKRYKENFDDLERRLWVFVNTGKSVN